MISGGTKANASLCVLGACFYNVRFAVKVLYFHRIVTTAKGAHRCIYTLYHIKIDSFVYAFSDACVYVRALFHPLRFRTFPDVFAATLKSKATRVSCPQKMHARLTKRAGKYRLYKYNDHRVYTYYTDAYTVYRIPCITLCDIKKMRIQLY